MKHIVWFCIFSIVAALFTSIGVYAWRSKKPMHFWSGSTVPEAEITDVPAYNRANGKMWISFSLVFWLAAFAGLWNISVAGILSAAGCLIGIPVLAAVYSRIFKKYRVR